MRKFSILIILIFSTLGTTAEWNFSHLSIYSSPADVEIRLNSVLLGKTPIKELSLKKGEYTIEALTPNTGVWNSENITRELSLKEGQDTTIYIRFPNLVRINSAPYHAKLSLDNQFIGLTPTALEYETYQGKEFLLEKAGFESRSFVLEDKTAQFYHLEPLKLATVENDGESFTHSLFHSNMKTKFAFLTGTVVTHWLAFYLKNRADENFDKYMVTGNPALMKKYRDNTQKYDRWSDISLGVSYALLGGLIYSVIR